MVLRSSADVKLVSARRCLRPSEGVSKTSYSRVIIRSVVCVGVGDLVLN